MKPEQSVTEQRIIHQTTSLLERFAELEDLSAMLPAKEPDQPNRDETLLFGLHLHVALDEETFVLLESDLYDEQMPPKLGKYAVRVIDRRSPLEPISVSVQLPTTYNSQEIKELLILELSDAESGHELVDRFEEPLREGTAISLLETLSAAYSALSSQVDDQKTAHDPRRYPMLIRSDLIQM